ncbi:MAG: MarR family transcriptional regulator [Phycisphaerae bacterium]|nr:MarR family transcriptional regulator [Phycisphaerae bacterium]
MASGHDIAMELRAAYWAMHRRTEAGLARRGVTADQFVLLALLEDQDGVTQQELVRRASSDANTVRAMLVRLESRGLVARGRHPTDRRARSVLLTRKGRQTYEKLWADSEAARQRLLAVFEPQEAEVLIEFLNRISKAMVYAPAARGPRRRPSPLRVGAQRLQEGEKR